MSSGLEHRECAESLGAYVLGALPEPESARIRAHLGSCRECRAEVEWLRAAADTLPASVPQVEPPRQLKARVMQIVEAEAELLQAAGEAADHPPPSRAGRIRRWLWPTDGGWARPGLALAGAGALAALALAVVLTSGGVGTRTIEAQFVGPARPAGAQASVEVRDGRAELVVHGLPAPAAGHVDELWVKHGQANPQPAGTFVIRSGSVKLERPVGSGDVVLVTVEPGRGSNAPTTQPFLMAQV
ncbi:MAG: anti-sigma factor domain-containing protein [Solirubrobacteraceae bacterium]